MLSFDSSLTDALTSHATEAFFTLKLYYNAEGATDVIHISDQDRVDGSDVYYGLVATWGNLTHSLDFFNFTTSTMNMSIKLINTDKTIQGGRFSDLFSTLNFANRKWELFLNTSAAGTYDTATRMIGSGVILGDMPYDDSFISMTLIDYTSRFHKQIPTNIVDSSSFPTAPEKNINKPIPCAWGDSYTKTGIGTIPTAGAEFDRYFINNAFPAIITERFDAVNSNIEAKVDNKTPHTLYANNVYMKIDDFFIYCDTTSIAGSPVITAGGVDWRVYIPLTSHNAYSGGSNYGQTFNQDFRISAPFIFTVTNGAVTVGWRIPKVPNFGTFTNANVFMALRNMLTDGAPVSPDSLVLQDEATNPIIDITAGWNDGGDADLKSLLTGGIVLWSAAQQDSWDLEGELLLEMTDAAGTSTCTIAEVGIEIEFEPSQQFVKEIREIYEVIHFSADNYDIEVTRGTPVPTSGGRPVGEKKIRSRIRTLSSPAQIEYLYCAGKFRKYGAWIDTIDGNARTDENGAADDPGYAQNDLIENPVYIIENVLRTELGLDSGVDGSDIDLFSFDTSGNTTNGYLGDIYNDTVTNVKFALSQWKFINSKSFIERMCKQILSWVFIGGDGKFKIKTLRRPTDYSSADKTIDFLEIDYRPIAKTDVDQVRNDIIVNYNHHYGQDQFLSSANPTSDATSEGATVNGIKQTLKYEIDIDTYDADTAGVTDGKGVADAYMTILKDRKVVIRADCKRPKYLDLEIGDIIDWTNWDSSIKIYGDSMVENGAGQPDYYMVIKTSKRPNGCSLDLIKVSE